MVGVFESDLWHSQHATLATLGDRRPISSSFRSRRLAMRPVVWPDGTYTAPTGWLAWKNWDACHEGEAQVAFGGGAV